jgi:hypothetical protein
MSFFIMHASKKRVKIRDSFLSAATKKLKKIKMCELLTKSDVFGLFALVI